MFTQEGGTKLCFVEFGFKHRNKIFTDLCGPFEVQLNVTYVVSPG